MTVSTDRTNIADAVAAVRDEIARACRTAGRDPSDVLLVGATKTVPDALVAEALGAGVAEIGENHAVALRDRRASFPDLRLHFIGTIQRGTARSVADAADVIQTLRPGSAFEAIEARLLRAGRRIDGLVEVDLAGRGNATPESDLDAFADRVSSSRAFRLVGLMTVPAADAGADGTRSAFRRLRQLRDRLREQHEGVRHLSMGMSGDLPIAVEEGATIVRVGSAIFGRRPEHG